MGEERGAQRSPAARAALFVLLAAYVVLAPAHWHVPRLRGGHLPEWAMFHAVGEKQCRVRFFTFAADGNPVVVDRRAVLGLDGPEVDRRQRALVKPKSVLRQAELLCRRLHVSDLRADAACATLDGWEQAFTVDQNLCPRERRRDRKRGRR